MLSHTEQKCCLPELLLLWKAQKRQRSACCWERSTGEAVYVPITCCLYVLSARNVGDEHRFEVDEEVQVAVPFCSD